MSRDGDDGAGLRYDMQRRRMTRCQADDDGCCVWRNCPQRRDDEPATSGRHCPHDIEPGESGQPGPGDGTELDCDEFRMTMGCAGRAYRAARTAETASQLMFEDCARQAGTERVAYRPVGRLAALRRGELAGLPTLEMSGPVRVLTPDELAQQRAEQEAEGDRKVKASAAHIPDAPEAA